MDNKFILACIVLMYASAVYFIFRGPICYRWFSSYNGTGFN